MDLVTSINKIKYKFSNNSSNFYNHMIYYGCKKKMLNLKNLPKKHK